MISNKMTMSIIAYINLEKVRRIISTKKRKETSFSPFYAYFLAL